MTRSGFEAKVFDNVGFVFVFPSEGEIDCGCVFLVRATSLCFALERNMGKYANEY